jgi:hypothetical protein
MKKLIATLVVGGLVAALVVGCGPTPSTPDSTKPATGPASTGTVNTKTTTGKVTKLAADSITVKPDSGDEKKFDVPSSVKVPDDVKVDSVAIVTETDGKVTKVEAKK